jgi:dUTP pyrophosphatase
MVVVPVDQDVPWQLPESHYPGDCGMDLYVSEKVTIGPMQFMDIPNNISVHIPDGYWAMITGRSSTLRKKGLFIPLSIIDNGYRGPLFSGAFNLTSTPVVVDVGERVAQMILLPVTVPMTVVGIKLEVSDRGNRGFGSTGK